MTLPYDYARCGSPCSLAEKCRRTDPGRPGYQSVMFFEGGDDCIEFIEKAAPMTPVKDRGMHE